MLAPGMIQVRTWRGLVCVLVLLVGGCGESSGPGDGGGDLISQQIGPEGGTVRTPDGQLTLIFPAGAVTQTQTITIETRAARQVGSEFAAFTVEHTFRLGPDGLAFQD